MAFVVGHLQVIKCHEVLIVDNLSREKLIRLKVNSPHQYHLFIRITHELIIKKQYQNLNIAKDIKGKIN